MRRRIILALLVNSAIARAQSTPNPAETAAPISPVVAKAAPANLTFLGPIKDAITKAFTAKPLHLTVKSIVPGGGPGIGPIYTWDHPSGEWHTVVNLDAVSSIRAYWLAEGRVRMLHPAFSQTTSAGDSFVVDLYARARDLPRLPFYGIGPNTSRANLTDYHERDIFAGVNILNPITAGFGIGGTLENIWPEISRPDGQTVRSVDRIFNQEGAPGFFAQPSFFHTALSVHAYHRYPFEVDSQFGYHYFHDNKGIGYSFHRFRGDVRYNFYPVFHGGQPRRDNVLSVHGVYELSFTNGSNRVPFYLQDTLGGSNINNEPTLRGFADFRFRAPNLVLIQTEYDKRLYSVLGMMAFYDTGRVADHPGQLNFGSMRHSFGFGGTVWLESRVFFRAYVGLGSGEGVHPFFGLASFF